MPGDKVKGYTSEAPIHLINEASVRYLEEQVKKRRNGREMPENWDLRRETFRANIYIDIPEVYREDCLSEMRVGPLLMRSTGPSIRC